MADFVATANEAQDYIGAFAVTSGGAWDAWAKELEAANDDYNAILIKTIADRLAESFAEWLHRKVRTGYWGYASDESLSNDQLIAIS